MRRGVWVYALGVMVCWLLAGSAGAAWSQATEATYVGSTTCLGCHSGTVAKDMRGWQNTLHAKLYREPRPENIVADFTGSVKLSDAANKIPEVTITFNSNGGKGPFTVSFLDSTFTVMRAHGGAAIDKNEDAAAPGVAGRSKFIGKQRFQTKIGNSYYILPVQWNPVPGLDGKSKGWVAYNLKDWVDTAGKFALGKASAEERKCAGCHQTGVKPSQNAQGEYVIQVAEENIACEACHGPGSEHIKVATTKPADLKIVNPSKLPADRANEVCGQCHDRGHSTGQVGGKDLEYPYSASLGRTYRPGEVLKDFYVSAGGVWPDGTSKQHHQQWIDFRESEHFKNGKLTCFACHTPHGEGAEHGLKKTARDNSLCLQCHAKDLPDAAAVQAHTRHKTIDPAKGLGRCVDCHMAAVQSSAVPYDIHAHTFRVIAPQTTIDKNMPNSCAVGCHRDGRFNASTFGLTDASASKWDEASDVGIAERLLNFFGWIGLVGTLDSRAGNLVAAKVATSPVVDGSADDAAWASARELKLRNGVTLKAVHDGKTLSVLAQWPDPTLSITRGESWTWDGSAWTIKPSSGQSEDRLAILWNISVSKFATDGCGVKCHGDLNAPGGEDDAFLDAPGERADSWHMKAARALGAISASQTGALTVDPVTHAVTKGRVTLNGYTDDKYVSNFSAANTPDGGRYGDAGGSIDTRNRNAAKTAPLYLEKDPADYIDAMILRQDEIDKGETLTVADASPGDISAAWAKYRALGAVVPERILRPPKGSRGDVRQAATWSDGVWTSEYQRLLVTGNDDDAQFNDLSKTYLFSSAVMDNSGGDAHNVADLLNKMTFEAGGPANAPLITLGVPLHHGLKAMKVRGVKAGQVVEVEVFGEDVKGATGFKAVLTYDAGKVKFEGFTVSPTIPGLTGLNIRDDAKGTVEIGGTTLEGAATVDRGLIGVVRFEALAGFSGRADITLKSSSVIRAEGRKDSEVASVISLADDSGAGPIALDLDVTAGKATEIKNARAGQVVEVEVFGEDIQGAMGFRATMAYDPVQLKFAGFTVGPTIPGLTGLNLKDDNKGTLEVGGVSLEGGSVVQKGSLGILKFEVLPGFSGVADVTLKTTSIIRPEGRKDFDAVWKVSITQFGTGPEPVGPPPGGPIQPKPGDGTGMVDLDVASGDQNSRTLSGVKPGQKVDVQVILNKEFAGTSGFQVVLKFDTKKLSVVGWKKDGTAFASAIDLAAQSKGDSVVYGASIFGGTTAAKKEAVAVLTFQTASDYSGDTEIVLVSLGIRISGAFNTLRPGASVVLSSGGPAGLASDFDGSGDVGFDDFFMFAGAFGQPGTGENKKFDLDGDGDIGFGDFFIFAGDFGKTTKSGKATTRPGVNAQASLSVGTVSSGDRLTAQVGASNVTQMRGYTVVVSYDPSSLAFVKAERAEDALLSRGGPTPLFLAREMAPGRVILADAVTGGGTASGDGALANLVFRRIGPDGAVGVDLAQVFDGSGGADVLAATKEMPSTYALAQNYPNPFNPETQVAYSLPEAGRVRLTVYNLVGQVVRTLVDGDRAAGRHSVRWDGRDEAGRTLASGVYLYRIEVNGFSAVRRMMLVK